MHIRFFGNEDCVSFTILLSVPTVVGSVNDCRRNGDQILSVLNTVLDRSTQHKEGHRLLPQGEHKGYFYF